MGVGILPYPKAIHCNAKTICHIKIPYHTKTPCHTEALAEVSQKAFVDFVNKI